MTLSVDPDGVRENVTDSRQTQANSDIDKILGYDCTAHALCILSIAESLRTQTKEYLYNGEKMPWAAAIAVAAAAYQLAPEGDP